MGCGECTACCTAFYVKWLDKPAQTPCIHCNGGCDIHDSKDFECDNFECAYIQSGVDNEQLRPDKCGVIFEKIADDTFLATPVKGLEITEAARNQMASFTSQGFKVMINGNL